jgi:translation elongation factor EF-G
MAYPIGAVIGGLNQRRGTIIDSEVRDDEFTCTAEVALNDMFGYSNQLRGSTQGKGMTELIQQPPVASYETN